MLKRTFFQSFPFSFLRKLENLLKGYLNSKSQTWQSLLLNCGLLILLVIIASVITSAYISDERTFYWWDLQNYNQLTSNTAAFLVSPSHGLPKAVQLVVRTLVSTKGPCNDYFTLPLAPFLLIFGDTRFIFILSIVLVYLLPFNLVLGAIATKLITGHPLDAIAQNGELLSTTQSTHSPQGPNHFSLQLQTNHASHLLLQISEDRRDKNQRDSCSLSIDPLIVESD